MLRLACQAMRQLHPEAIAAIQSKALFSKAEEQLLSKVGSVRLRTGTGYRLNPWKSTVWGGLPAPSMVCIHADEHICRDLCGGSWEKLSLAPWVMFASSRSLTGLRDRDGVGMRKPWLEEHISCSQTSQPTLETFQDLLHRHPDAFYLTRTAKALQAHWQLMRQYYLLEDQTGNTPAAAA